MDDVIKTLQIRKVMGSCKGLALGPKETSRISDVQFREELMVIVDPLPGITPIQIFEIIAEDLRSFRSNSACRFSFSEIWVVIHGVRHQVSGRGGSGVSFVDFPYEEVDTLPKYPCQKFKSRDLWKEEDPIKFFEENSEKLLIDPYSVLRTRDIYYHPDFAAYIGHKFGIKISFGSLCKKIPVDIHEDFLKPPLYAINESDPNRAQWLYREMVRKYTDHIFNPKAKSRIQMILDSIQP